MDASGSRALFMFLCTPGGRGSFQAVKLQRPARATVCSHSVRDATASVDSMLLKTRRLEVVTNAHRMALSIHFSTDHASMIAEAWGRGRNIWMGPQRGRDSGDEAAPQVSDRMISYVAMECRGIPP